MRFKTAMFITMMHNENERRGLRLNHREAVISTVIYYLNNRLRPALLHTPMGAFHSYISQKRRLMQICRLTIKQTNTVLKI